MSILIPAYRPSAGLLTLVRALLSRSPGATVVVVDDGSGPAYADTFAQVRAAGARVIEFQGNRGKGAALRAGFAYLELRHPSEAVVCADADGQHTVEDIARVLAAVGDQPRQMVLGVRSFDGAVPLRSRVGNSLTRLIFAAATRRWLSDTQTGLRAYSPDLLGWLQGVDGDRYEYELRVLLAAAGERMPYRCVPIETVYLDDNASSHFRPVADSLRIYLPLVGFAFSSIGTAQALRSDQTSSADMVGIARPNNA